MESEDKPQQIAKIKQSIYQLTRDISELDGESSTVLNLKDRIEIISVLEDITNRLRKGVKVEKLSQTKQEVKIVEYKKLPHPQIPSN